MQIFPFLSSQNNYVFSLTANQKSKLELREGPGEKVQDMEGQTQKCHHVLTVEGEPVSPDTTLKNPFFIQYPSLYLPSNKKNVSLFKNIPKLNFLIYPCQADPLCLKVQQNKVIFRFLYLPQ